MDNMEIVAIHQTLLLLLFLSWLLALQNMKFLMWFYCSILLNMNHINYYV